MDIRSATEPQASSSKVSEQQTVEEDPLEPGPKYEPGSLPIPTVHPSQADMGICLITRQAEPKIAMQVCHILPYRTPEKIVEEYKKQWKSEDFSVEATFNLVSLRSDWHASYDGDCWAFVPSLDILKEIMSYGKKGTFKTPYRGYKTNTEIDYAFVAFPTLLLKYIVRDDEDHAMPVTFPYEKGYPNFPVLQHHSHPFLVIANALPKFRKHRKSLTEPQAEIFGFLIHIEKLWNSKHPPDPPKLSTGKRCKDNPGEGPPDDKDGGSPPKKKRRGKEKEIQAKSLMAPLMAPPPTAGKGKGKGHQLKGDFVEIGPPQFYPSPPVLTKDDSVYFQKMADIMTWITGVHADGPSEPVEEEIIESNGEVCRAPFIGDWHKWCRPWTRPPEHSQFSSNDWALNWYVCRLTAEPDSSVSSDEDVSDREHYTSWSS